jgi:hypothetical protein
MEILPTTARRRRGAPDSGVSRADSPRALGASAGWLMGRPVIGGLVVCFSLLPAWAVIIGSNCVAQRGTSARSPVVATPVGALPARVRSLDRTLGVSPGIYSLKINFAGPGRTRGATMVL